MATPPMVFGDETSMLASIPSGIMEELSTPPSEIGTEEPPAGDDAPVEDTPAETPESDEAGDEDAGAPEEDAEPEEEPEPKAEDEPAEDEKKEPAGRPPAKAPAKATAETPEELPEGVTVGKDSKGRQKFFLEPSRYKSFLSDHQLVNELSQTLAEPLTAEAIDLRNRAYLGQERLINSITSADPVRQGEVVDFILDEMTDAHRTGEVGEDPTATFADAVYDKFRAREDNAYAQLRMRSAKDFVEELFRSAGASDDKRLIGSAQQVVRFLVGMPPPEEGTDMNAYLDELSQRASAAGIPFYRGNQLGELKAQQQPNELAAARQRIRELETLQNGNSAASAKQEFENWSDRHRAETNTAIETDAVSSALAPFAEKYKAFPDEFEKRVLKPLRAKVAETLHSDPALQQKVAPIIDRIRRVTDPKLREQLGRELTQHYVNRAKLAAEREKGPLLKEAAEWLAFKSQNNHARHSAGQTRSAPKGPSAPINRSIVPEPQKFPDNKFDPDYAYKQAVSAVAKYTR